MSIKVMVAFSNMLFSEGICRILENDDSIKVTDVLKAGNQCSLEKLETQNPDVILVDFTTLYNSFPALENSKKSGFILIDTNCGRDNIVSAILRKKVSGVLLGNATPSLLKKAIHAVAEGEVWIDKSTVKTLVYGINALDRTKNSTLTEREKEIVRMVGQGYRNKEIASKLRISEPTVKTHLHSIFQKLEVKNRAQLITFAVKHDDVS